MGKELTPGEARVWEDEASEIDLVDILSALWKRRLVVAAAVIVCAACAAAYLVAAPRAYESRTTLLFLPPLPSEIGDEKSRNVVLTPDTYFTLATADDLLNDVIEEAYSGAPGEEAPSVGALRAALSVKLAESSQKARDVPNQVAMTVSFKAKDPETAMKVLSAWSRLFIQKNAQFFVDRSGASFEFLGKSAEAVKKDLETAEDRLLAYRKNNPIPLMKLRLEAKGEIYSGLLKQYNEKAAALPPMEAKAKASAKLLANEPETKTLSRGMSSEALWNLSAQGASRRGEDSFNVRDEIPNPLYRKLKDQAADAETETASLRAAVKDLGERIERTQKEYAELNVKIMAAETEVARLSRERTTLAESYAEISKQYQLSRVATVEAANPIKVVESPITPREPVSRGGLKILCLASLLGLFFGATLALIAEMFAKRKEAA